MVLILVSIKNVLYGVCFSRDLYFLVSASCLRTLATQLRLIVTACLQCIREVLRDVQWTHVILQSLWGLGAHYIDGQTKVRTACETCLGSRRD